MQRVSTVRKNQELDLLRLLIKKVIMPYEKNFATKFGLRTVFSK